MIFMGKVRVSEMRSALIQIRSYTRNYKEIPWCDFWGRVLVSGGNDRAWLVSILTLIEEQFIFGLCVQ